MRIVNAFIFETDDGLILIDTGLPGSEGRILEAIAELDREPADGLDMSTFLLWWADSSGQDHFVYMGSDGELLSVKWKTIKVHFRYTESTSWIAPYIKPQIPMVCDLISDPHETIDLMQSDLIPAWVIGAALRPVITLAQSAKQYRHIQVGEEDFNGYD